MKNKTLVTTLSLLILWGFVLGVSQANAQNKVNFDTLVQRIAQKFNLKEADVQTVFNDYYAQRQAQMQKSFEDRLSEEVKSGQITEAQKKIILEKRQELLNQKINWTNKTPQERRELMQQHRTDLENWAKQNNIDLRYLMGGGFAKKGFMHIKK